MGTCKLEKDLVFNRVKLPFLA